LDSITLGILSGESYDGIRAVADLFVVLKYLRAFLATLSGTNNPGDDAKKCQYGANMIFATQCGIRM
jgi:hypothetical protein